MLTKSVAYVDVQSGMENTVAILNKLGWRARVRIDARTATVHVRTERKYLRQVRLWFQAGLIDGMALVCKPMTLLDRLQTRAMPVVVELRGF